MDPRKSKSSKNNNHVAVLESPQLQLGPPCKQFPCYQLKSPDELSIAHCSKPEFRYSDWDVIELDNCSVWTAFIPDGTTTMENTCDGPVTPRARSIIERVVKKDFIDHHFRFVQWKFVDNSSSRSDQKTPPSGGIGSTVIGRNPDVILCRPAGHRRGDDRLPNIVFLIFHYWCSGIMERLK